MFDLIAPIVASLALSTTPLAHARTILITNDDGLTSNVVALYRALKAKGYDVIVSVPCADQSGMGTAVRIGKALQPIATNCRADAARAGDPGAGPMTKNGFTSNFFYVDGTPVMALLYGLDVASRRRWHHSPDLVLSGPNEGQNLGGLIIASGTVSAAQFAALRGIPAIALSASAATSGGNGIDNPASTPVARLTTTLVSELDGQASDGPLLPRSVVLNVNFPDDLAGAKWQLTRVGTYEAYTVVFADDRPDVAANARGAVSADRSTIPGIRVGRNYATPRPDQMQDEALIARKDITISPLQVGYDGTKMISPSTLHLSHLLDARRAEQ